MREFGIIRQYFNWPVTDFSLSADETDCGNILLPTGDDASAITVPTEHSLVQSIDTQVAGVHFPENAPADRIAQRALRCAISDLAAMGATPHSFHLALSLPSGIQESWIRDFSHGLKECALNYNIPLIGGDTTSAPVTVISIQVQGITPQNKILTRSGAQPGDNIWVTGQLGGASAVLQQIIDQPDTDIPLAQSYYYPKPCITAGKVLLPIATSAMDISDGLLQDAAHIASASGVVMNIKSNLIPLNPLMTSSGIREEDQLQYALTGGDEYQLLFTAPPSVDSMLERISKETELTCIGNVIQTNQNQRPEVLLDAEIPDFKRTGYQHF